MCIFVDECKIFLLYWSFYHYIVSSIFVAFALKFILSDMNIVSPTFFIFAWNIFFHALTFNLYVYVDLL